MITHDTRGEGNLGQLMSGGSNCSFFTFSSCICDTFYMRAPHLKVFYPTEQRYVLKMSFVFVYVEKTPPEEPESKFL